MIVFTFLQCMPLYLYLKNVLTSLYQLTLIKKGHIYICKLETFVFCQSEIDYYRLYW